MGVFKAGASLKVEAKNGVPTSPYWRNRIKDAEIDNCVSVLVIEPPKRKKQIHKPKEADL
jgi:hypothetical protein